MIRRYRAFVESRFICAKLCISRYRNDTDKLNLIITGAIRQTLRLSPRPSTDRLEALGLYSNIEQLIEAKLTCRYKRLSSSDTILDGTF